jgi:hypothetical protein
VPEINSFQSSCREDQTIILGQVLILIPGRGVEFAQASVQVSSHVYAFEMREVALRLRLAAHGRGSHDRAGGEVLDAFVRGIGLHDDDIARVFAGADDA